MLLSLPPREPLGTTVEPTGKELIVEVGVFATLDDDGLIAEDRGYLDATGVAMQLGLVG